VARALAKRPEHRHADAAALLDDLERLRRGEPASLAVHPRLPAVEPDRVLAYDFRWELEAPPERLWPLVSNTERLNRALGLSAIHFTTEADPTGRVRRFGRLRKLGLEAAWQEHPFEWVEARRFGVLRECSRGPFRWLLSVVELSPRGSGTTLTHSIRLEPTGLLGRTLAAVEVGVRTRRALGRVYRRIDAALAGQAGSSALVDPFEEPPRLTPAQRRRLDEGLDRLAARGVAPAIAERLGDFLSVAAPQEVARIRPLALARRLGLDPEALLAGCLHGAREGLLVLLWDLLCPLCRIPSEVADTLRALRRHGRCEVCNLDYELDFARSVELVFRAHPAVRDVELGTYCVGGPAHSPHVVAQVRVAVGERIELELSLAEGAYRLRGPQLPAALDLRVRPAEGARRWELDLGRSLAEQAPGALRADGQVLVLANGTDVELLVRLERTAPRDDALTAARASALALFRELFPGEVLAPGQLVSVANLTFLLADLHGAGELYERLGEARAFALVHDFLRALEGHVRQHGGALVKAVGEGAVAVFPEPAAAVRAALELPGLPAALGGEGVRLRAAVHRGPARAATVNDHLDYFGTTVRQAACLAGLARGGERVLSQAVMADLQVAELLRGRGLEGEVFRADLPGYREAVLHRFREGVR
jgi:class 3 adenylate cyclase